MRRWSGIGLVAIAALAFALYAGKYEVRRLERRVAVLERHVDDERERLRSLRAEHAFLIRPERLARLAATHLDLRPANVSRVLPMAAIPLRAELVPERELQVELASGTAVALRLKPVLAARHATLDRAQ